MIIGYIILLFPVGVLKFCFFFLSGGHFCSVQE